MAEAKHTPATAVDRIRFQDDDEETGRARRGRPSLHRSRSNDSAMSIRRATSRGKTDPSLALPIQYRTVSFQVEESKGKEQVELRKAQDKAAKDLSDLVWHTLPTEEVSQRLNTSATTGLSSDQAKRRVEEYGRNAPSPPETHLLKTWFGYFFKGFGGILLVGAILVFVSWKPLGEPAPAIANLALAIVLVAVFIIQAVFNMFQDWSTSRVMASIKDMLPEQCEVIRDGTQMHLPGEEVVPGDVVIIKAGSKLPADMRFVEVSSDAKFDRSVLTGESVPCAATVEHTDTNYLETHNIGLQGTHCIMGSCRGVIVAIGDKTVFGRIARLTNEPKTKMTPLEREILYFVLIICSLMLAMVVLVIIIWSTYLRPYHPDFINVPTLIVNCVSVAIAFIPEGLPIAVTAGLTITANLMQKHKILCKSLKTVETLGSVSVVCSDKTGTLTEGKMTTSDCAIGETTMTADEAVEHMSLHGKLTGNPVSQLRSMSALCNAADLDAAGADLPLAQRKIFGDATDSAILRFAEQLEGGSVGYMRACWGKTYELAFNSKNKFMIRCFANARPEAIHQTLTEAETRDFQDKDLLLTIKGAPDVLIGRCSKYVTGEGLTADLTPEKRAHFESLKNKYSSEGKRCLVLARKILPAGTITAPVGSTEYENAVVEQSKTGLTVVGLVAIVDPLRSDIRDVVKTLRGAGVRIAMVTGDFALTAVAIARDAGIVTASHVDTPANLPRFPHTAEDASTSSDNEKAATAVRKAAIVLSGPELMALNEHQWAELTRYEEVVFARTTPEQKLRIVREFQRDNTVAMTGDGVNDAPSLKAADVGIALGSGSDIAMEAADMVLLESFSSIVVAVQYGRVVFDNLKKVISYLLPAGSFSEFWPVMASVAFGLPQILSSFLMIIICCFTDCAAATMLSYEQPEADVLTRPPRNAKKDRLVNWQLILQSYGVIGVIQTVLSFTMSFWYLERNGIPFSKLWFGYGPPADIDPDYYTQRINEASSIYFVNLVVMQWFNLMATRTRRLSIFQHPPLLNRSTQNWYLFPAILFSLAMAVLWLYIPQLQPVLGTTGVPVEHWFFPFAFGLFTLLLDEARKYAVRRWPQGLVARAAW